MVTKWLSGHSDLGMMAAYLPITDREREQGAESTHSFQEQGVEHVCVHVHVSSKSLFCSFKV